MPDPIQTIAVPVLVTPAECAAILKVTPDVLARWRTKGHGPAFRRVGRLIRYEISDVTDWLEGQRRASTADPGPSAGKR